MATQLSLLPLRRHPSVDGDVRKQLFYPRLCQMFHLRLLTRLPAINPQTVENWAKWVGTAGLRTVNSGTSGLMLHISARRLAPTLFLVFRSFVWCLMFSPVFTSTTASTNPDTVRSGWVDEINAGQNRLAHTQELSRAATFDSQRVYRAAWLSWFLSGRAKEKNETSVRRICGCRIHVDYGLSLLLATFVYLLYLDRVERLGWYVRGTACLLPPSSKSLLFDAAVRGELLSREVQ